MSSVTCQMYSSSINSENNELLLWCLNQESEQILIRVPDFQHYIDIFSYEEKTLEDFTKIGEALVLLTEDSSFLIEPKRRIFDGKKALTLTFISSKLESISIAKRVVDGKSDFTYHRNDLFTNFFNYHNIKTNQWFNIAIQNPSSLISKITEYIGIGGSMIGIPDEETMNWKVYPSILSFKIFGLSTYIGFKSCKYTTVQKHHIFNQNESNQIENLISFIESVNPVIITGFEINNNLKKIYNKIKKSNHLSQLLNKSAQLVDIYDHSLLIPGRITFDFKRFLFDYFGHSGTLSDAMAKFKTEGADFYSPIINMFESLDIYSMIMQKAGITNKHFEYCIINRYGLNSVVDFTQIDVINNLKTRPIIYNDNLPKVEFNVGIYKDVIRYEITSLYTSIIITNNICTSTLAADDVPDDKCNIFNIGDQKVRFLKSEIREGVLPNALRRINTEKNKIKKQLETSDVETTKILNYRIKYLNQLYLNAFVIFMRTNNSIPYTCVIELANNTIDSLKEFLTSEYDSEIVYCNNDYIMFCNERYHEIKDELESEMNKRLEIKYKNTTDMFVYGKHKYCSFNECGSMITSHLLNRPTCEINKKLYETLCRRIIYSKCSFTDLFDCILDTFRVFQTGVNKSMVSKKLHVGSYRGHSNYVAMFVRNLLSIGLKYEEGDRLEYYVVRSESNMLGDKMRLLDHDYGIDEEIDSAYYFSRMSNIDDMFEAFCACNNITFPRVKFDQVKIRRINLKRPCKSLSTVIECSTNLEEDIKILASHYE